ncbi:MAG TPA: transcription termination/antitermination NusG family protein, partial [Massilibacterium sp.]|nr:transcription termination/antitermination NusG family protein [Massilibacterium sp.]
MEKRWYVLHTYSGYENRVKTNLEKRVESMGMQDKIFRVVVPEEEEKEVKNGKEKIVKKRIFPGYVIVEMIMTDDSWYVVRNTPGVTGQEMTDHFRHAFTALERHIADKAITDH